MSFKKTSNSLVTLVETKEDCPYYLKLSEPHRAHAGSLSSSGSEFQTVGPAVENAKRETAVRVESTARYDELVSVCRRSRQESSAQLTIQRVSYTFTSSPFSFHARHILTTSQFQHSYSCILINFYRHQWTACARAMSVNTVHWFDASCSVFPIGWSPSAWGSLDTWLARPLRKITTVSSPLL